MSDTEDPSEKWHTALTEMPRSLKKRRSNKMKVTMCVHIGPRCPTSDLVSVQLEHATVLYVAVAYECVLSNDQHPPTDMPVEHAGLRCSHRNPQLQYLDVDEILREKFGPHDLSRYPFSSRFAAFEDSEVP